MQLHELLPYKRKPIKKQNNTRFKKLYNRALKLEFNLHEKNQGYYTIWEGGKGSSYRTLNEIELHIKSAEGDK
jgi:hypothetical protein